MFAFWESVPDLHQIEWVILLVIMVVSLFGGTLLLSIRYRIKVLQTRSTSSLRFTSEENIHRLQNQNQQLEEDLEQTRRELLSAQQVNAPRQISAIQATILAQELQGVKVSPVIVTGYAFEEESSAYATQIAGALRQAGLQVSFAKSSMNDFKGVSLGVVNLMHQPISGVHELAAALTAARIDLHQREISPDSIAGPLQDGSILVVVGRK